MAGIKPIIPLYKRITVYHYMIAVLSFLGLFYIVSLQRFDFLPQLILAPLTAVLVEALFLKLKKEKVRISESAIISGLFAAIILQNLSLAVAAPILAITIKMLLKVKGRHIFNPAALGIIVVSLIAGLFGIVNTNPAIWWAASTVLIMPLGLFMAWKIKRLETSLVLLAVYFALNVAWNFLSGFPISLQSFYDPAAMFLAFFMAVEPRTTPANKYGKIIFGVLLAALMFAGFFIPLRGLAIDWCLISLLIANTTREFLEEKL